LKTCIITTDTYLNHDTGQGHPERADRVTVIIDHLKKIKSESLVWKKPEKFEIKYLELAHDKNYLDNVKLPNGKRLPFMTMLRASQNYIRAAERGLSIFELAPSKTYYDREQWAPLLRWLNSKRSIPN